jgi:charged multivesicular body protein 2A
MTNEDIKDSKRMIVRAGRKMDRERKKLERENVKARKEIGKLAKKGQHNAAKIMSKDVARLNNQIQQTYMVTSQLKAIEFQLSSAMATKEISGIMGISAETLAAVNENMDISSIMNV